VSGLLGYRAGSSERLRQSYARSEWNFKSLDLKSERRRCFTTVCLGLLQFTHGTRTEREACAVRREQQTAQDALTLTNES